MTSKKGEQGESMKAGGSSHVALDTRVAIFAAALTTLFALALGAAPTAFAAADRLWDACDAGSPAGQRCTQPRGIVADPVSGHVFVGDSGNNRVAELDAWGNFVRAWGWDVVASGPGDDTTPPEDQFEVCEPEVGDVCKVGLAGTGVGQFSSLSGLAVDSAGDVYVHDVSARRVQKFSSGGAFMLMFGGKVNKTKVEEGGPASEQNLCPVDPSDTCQGGSLGVGPGEFDTTFVRSTAIAISLDDKVYVGDTGRIQRFDTSGAYLDEIALGGKVGKHLAVDSAGKLYAVYREGFADKADVHKIDPETGAEILSFEVADPWGLTVAPNGDLYVLHGAGAIGSSAIDRFDATGTLLESFGVDEEFGSRSIGMAANAVTAGGDAGIYLASEGSGGDATHFVRAYGPLPAKFGPPSSVPPQIEAQYADAVGTRDVQLGAVIDPRFWLDATYQVEYGKAECAEKGACEAIVPAVPATLGGGTTGFGVTAIVDIGGLEPGTRYFYRFIAMSGGGEALDGPSGSFVTFPAPTEPTACTNDSLRTGPSTVLPDCRAYEMVSPLDKNGGDAQALSRPEGTIGRLAAYKQAAPGGDKITYSAAAAFGDALSGPFTSQYIASRGAGGWSTHGISPPRGTAIVDGKAKLPLVNWDAEDLFDAFTPDLCHAWVRDTNLKPLTAGALEGYVNLYERSNCGASADSYEPLSLDTVDGPGAPAPYAPAADYLNDATEDIFAGSGPGLRFQGASADRSHQVFVSGAALTPAPESLPGKNSQLYDLHNGSLTLVSVLPDGTADTHSSVAGAMGSASENRQSNLTGAVSADGSRVFWTSRAGSAQGAGKIYMRLNPGAPESATKDGKGDCVPEEGRACTLAVSEVVAGSAALFWAASPNGSTALFSIGECLYAFDVETAIAGAGEPASKLACQSRGVLGASDDLSRIYFMSREALDAAGEAIAGENNLYMGEAGKPKLVATLADVDDAIGGGGLMSPINPQPVYRASRVTPDGRYAAFQALGSPTGYDNEDPVSGKRFSEVYRYDAVAEELDCISCNPTGVRPSGPEVLQPYSPGKAIVFQQDRLAAAALLPTWERELYPSRVLSEDGKRVYFHSYESLSLRDTNGVKDVYQWEAPGTGTCTVGDSTYFAQNGGCIDLISTGTSPQGSEFVDASANGRDVFISTTSNIDPRDERLIDIYDARVEGGFPLPAAAPECLGDACQSVPPRPNRPGLASNIFNGPGDPTLSRDCGAAARRAGKLARRARGLRRRAARTSSARRSRVLRRRSARLSRRAKGLSTRAKRCRRANRRAAR